MGALARASRSPGGRSARRDAAGGGGVVMRARRLSTKLRPVAWGASRVVRRSPVARRSSPRAGPSACAQRSMGRRGVSVVERRRLRSGSTIHVLEPPALRRTRDEWASCRCILTNPVASPHRPRDRITASAAPHSASTARRSRGWFPKCGRRTRALGAGKAVAERGDVEAWPTMAGATWRPRAALDSCVGPLPPCTRAPAALLAREYERWRAA